jgi:catechol 2,3-dioxygenase-like lactoylglutathione lyase family enzyme
MILGVNHVALSVPDMDKALEFYCDLLGFEKLSDAGWPAGTESADRILAVEGTSARVCHIGTENLLMELFQFGDCDPVAQDPRRPVIDHGITHICLAVTDLDDEYARLSAAGMEFNSPPTEVGIPGVRTVYGRDPFGNVVELEEAIGRVKPQQPPMPVG